MHLKREWACGGCEQTAITTYLELLELRTSELYAFQTHIALGRVYYPSTSKMTRNRQWRGGLTRSWRRKEDAWQAQNE